MLIRPTEEELRFFGTPDFTIYNAGAFKANRCVIWVSLCGWVGGWVWVGMCVGVGVGARAGVVSQFYALTHTRILC